MQITVTEDELIRILRALNLAADYHRCYDVELVVASHKQFNPETVANAELAEKLEVYL